MENYEQVRDTAKFFYADLKPIYCKAISSDVKFNRIGFQHIIHKKGRHIRETPSQIERFKLLPLAVKLLELTTTYQEYESEPMKLEVEHLGVDVFRNKRVTYWGIIAILDGKKVKVILRQVGNGAVHFWSIIPDWTTSKRRDTKYFSFMKGNPSED